jgi:feruloyl-CoA synthase
LRNRIRQWFAPYVRDAVIAGPDRNFLARLFVPNLEACRLLATTLPPDAEVATVLKNTEVTNKFNQLLDSFAAQATGNSNRVTRAILLDELPSLDAGEITDKASLNQRVILERRAALVDEIYSSHPTTRVLQTSQA